MRLRAVFSFLLILLMVAAVSGCAKKEEPKTEASSLAISAVEEGQVLFENMCGVCHTLGRATARTETKEKWASILGEEARLYLRCGRREDPGIPFVETREVNLSRNQRGTI
jgi:mono/diheme cytochrome c family protein